MKFASIALTNLQRVFAILVVSLGFALLVTAQETASQPVITSDPALFDASVQFVESLCNASRQSIEEGRSPTDALPEVLPENLRSAFNKVLNQFGKDATAVDPPVIPPAFLSSAINRGHGGQERRVGTRFTWALNPQVPDVASSDKATVALTESVTLSLLGADRPLAYVLQTGVEKPQLLLRLDADCRWALQRMIDYGESGQQLALYNLDSDGTVQGSPEWLNPPLPESKGSLQSKESAQSKDSATSASSAMLKVAIIDSGVNYLLPELNRSLARDATGNLLGFDFWDNDKLPFDAHPVSSPFQVQRHGTRTAALFLEEAPFASLIPYRYPRGNMHRMEDVLKRIDAQGVLLVGMPLGGNRRDDWEVFYREAKRYPHILFVVSAGNNDRDIDQQPVYPASLDLPNMVVVSSADGTARPARGSNWGRQHVDYLLPAENIELTDFDGSTVHASGSSYAVPKMLAMLARLLVQNPDWQATELLAELRRLFNDGASARYVTGGYIGDPLSVARSEPVLELLDSVQITAKQHATDGIATENTGSDERAGEKYALKLNIVVLHDSWTLSRIQPVIDRVAGVLSSCAIELLPAEVSFYDTLPHLRNMSVGHSKTLRQELSLKRPTIYLLDETRLLRSPDGELFRFDAEAFGRGNTRYRSWLLDTVWISSDVIDADLAVAHELMHVLMNSGEHNDLPGNLMNAATSATNTRISPRQCLQAIENGVANGLMHKL